MFLTLLALTRVMSLFGGEDPVAGPWHHENQTRTASRRADFAAAPADDIAWHADYVDSYQYNPLWWAPGGLPRLKASLSTEPWLATLHFDDLFSSDQIEIVWQRYLSGTVAGLIWAWGENDTAAARNIVGASLHAVEDFYSHSNWVDDPARRSLTYLRMGASRRRRAPLWTGSYEKPDHLGIKPHGKPAPICALLDRVEEFMKIACHAASPISNGSLCQAWRECKDSTNAQIRSVAGVPLPDNIYYIAPPGVAIDTTWQANIAVRARELKDLEGRDLFEVAYQLAENAAFEWLELLRRLMNELNAEAFWARVQNEELPREQRERQYEDFSRFPYMFLAAGPYPPPTDQEVGDWYLRVLLETDPEPGSGTNSNIAAIAEGLSSRLDYMPEKHPLLAYDDFEPGDKQVYYVGPFQKMPSRLVLDNQSSDIVDVLKALGRTFVAAVDRAIEAARQFLLSLIAGNADRVGGAKQVWTPDQLNAVPDDRAVDFSVRVDGRSEGRYILYGQIRRISRSESGGRSWSSYEVVISSLKCEKESEWDRGSSSDEPYILSVLISQATTGPHEQKVLGPYSDVDSNEVISISQAFGTVRVPDDIGYLCLPVYFLESDDEGTGTRVDELSEFSGRLAEETADDIDSFLTTLGAAIAADWKLSRAQVFAFCRAQTVVAGKAFDAQIDRWIRAGESLTLNLDLADPKVLDATLAYPKKSVKGVIEPATSLLTTDANIVPIIARP